MAHKAIDAARAHARSIVKHDVQVSPELGGIGSRAEFLFWFFDHCADYTAVPVFVEEAKSDVAALLYAAVVGMEKTFFVHARGVVENLVRHFYFDCRGAEFVRFLQTGEFVTWKELVENFVKVPRFDYVRPLAKAPAADPVAPAPRDAEVGTLRPVLDALTRIYSDTSKFVHSSTHNQRMLYEGIEKIRLSPDRLVGMEQLFRRVYDVCFHLLAIYHVGPFVLVSQPIRRFALRGMNSESRRGLLECLGALPLDWVEHQREAALATQKLRRSRRRANADGLLHQRGRVSMISPP